MRRATRSARTARALLLAGATWAAAWTAACQEGGTQAPRDLSGGSGGDGGGGQGDGGGGADLLPRPAVMTTIRDLNDGKVPVDSFVQVDAVVTAPAALASAVTQNQFCLYELYIAQFAAVPTLHDGISVRQDERVASGDMMIDSAQCQARTPTVEVGKYPRNTAVRVRAFLRQRGSLRYLDLGTEKITDRGPAPVAEQPLPVDVMTQQLVSVATGMATPAAFYDASGALVRFSRVTTLQRNTTTQTFKVAPTAGGAAETRINPAYLKLAAPTYMAPPDATALTSLTGLVTIDIGGTVVPRDGADVKP